MTQPFTNTLYFKLIVTTLVGTLLFLLDWQLYAEVSSGILYIGLALLGLWYAHKQAVLYLAVLGTILIGAGCLLTGGGASFEREILLNRGIALAVLWLVAITVFIYKGRDEALLNNEKYFRNIFEASTEGILIADRQGVMRRVNSSLCRMMGYQEEELTGQPVELLIPDHLTEKHRHHRQDYAKNPEKRAMGGGLDLYAKRKDGNIFPVEISLTYFQAKASMRVMALITDITETKQAKERLVTLNKELEVRVAARTEELEDSQQLYHMIARHFPNGMISVFDHDLNYIFAEGKELYQIGITSDDLIGTNFLDRVDPAVKMKVRKKLKKVFKGVDATFELTSLGRTFLVNAVGLPDAKGEIPRILVVSQNITRQKKVEQAAMRALEKEQYLNELKSRFVAIASHEFRTPLTSIMNAVSLLKKHLIKEHPQANMLRHTDRIQTSLYHLTTILNDFLSLDKLEAGKVDMQPATFNLPDTVRELVQEMEQVAKRKQTIAYRHQGEKVAVLDKQVLRNVTNNLLSNAVKYSPEGSRVTLHTKLKGQILTIEVKDKGIGIPDDEQAQLFERFFRAHNAADIPGTGLGLNIVKKYVDIAGGNISLESRPGRGSTFVVTLPVKKENKGEAVRKTYNNN